MLPVELIRVLEVDVMAGGLYRFKITLESDSTATRRRPTFVYNGNELPSDYYMALFAKAKAAGLITKHPSFYHPDRAAAREQNAAKQAKKYKPEVVPLAVYQAMRKKKLKVVKQPTRGAVKGKGACVAKGIASIPGYALVAHHPLKVGEPVVAVDLGGEDWYNGRVIAIVGSEGTIRFDYYSPIEDVTRPINSSLIRYRLQPPPAPVPVAAASAISPKKRWRAEFDLNYTSSSSDEDEDDEEELELDPSAVVEEQPEVITEPETSEDDVEDAPEEE